MKKTWILLGDFHCGSTTGLTCEPTNEIQEGLFKTYENCISTLGTKPDVVVCNGDAIHGEDVKGRDTYLGLVADQAEIAAKLLLMWKAKEEYIIVSGTPYHTSLSGQPMENLVVGYLQERLRDQNNTTTKVSLTRKLKSKINDWFRIESRHKIGRSVIPHGKSTPQARAKIWNVLNAALKGEKWADLMVFSHVHYFNKQQDRFGTVISLPCWQAIGSRYGDEECDGHIDLGAVKLIVGEKESNGWELLEKLYDASMVSRWENR